MERCPIPCIHKLTLYLPGENEVDLENLRHYIPAKIRTGNLPNTKEDCFKSGITSIKFMLCIIT
jgi:hypothetical protein